MNFVFVAKNSWNFQVSTILKSIYKREMFIRFERKQKPKNQEFCFFPTFQMKFEMLRRGLVCEDESPQKQKREKIKKKIENLFDEI